MKMKYLLLLVCTNCYAAINPSLAPEDARMKFVKYNPDNVVRLTTEPGRVTVIELDKNENVVSKTYGSKEKWAIVSKDNTVQLGPKAQSGNTNLVIKTDKRLYFLDLIVTKNRGTYRVKYLYDSPLQTSHLYNQKRIWVRKKPNFCYYGFGDRELKPVLVYDDGVFTYFKFANHLNLPAVYALSEDGSEAIVSSHVSKSLIVVHEVSKRFNLRLGKKVLGIINKGALRNNFNDFYSTDGSFRKVIKK